MRYHDKIVLFALFILWILVTIISQIILSKLGVDMLSDAVINREIMYNDMW